MREREGKEVNENMRYKEVVHPATRREIKCHHELSACDVFVQMSFLRTSFVRYAVISNTLNPTPYPALSSRRSNSDTLAARD